MTPLERLQAARARCADDVLKALIEIVRAEERRDTGRGRLCRSFGRVLWPERPRAGPERRQAAIG
jgi:hypothetical protein